MLHLGLTRTMAVMLAVLLPWVSMSAAGQGSDARIRRRLVAASIARYPGHCPCPYSRDRAGRRCGRRSAWSRPGGRAPLCYPSDVSTRRIRAYRKRHAGRR